jgi:hydrogenase maturation protease
LSAASHTRVLAVGSPHGDDRAGWEVVGRLRREVPGVDAAAIRDPVSVLHHLAGCTGLVVVDACRSGAPPGTVRRLAWPDAGLDGRGGHSTHGLGLAGALDLAAVLGRLPPRVILFGVEAQGCEPGAEISPPVRAALPGLYRRVLAEVRAAGPMVSELSQASGVFPAADGGLP